MKKPKAECVKEFGGSAYLKFMDIVSRQEEVLEIGWRLPSFLFVLVVVEAEKTGTIFEKVEVKKSK